MTLQVPRQRSIPSVRHIGHDVLHQASPLAVHRLDGHGRQGHDADRRPSGTGAEDGASWRRRPQNGRAERLVLHNNGREFRLMRRP